MSIQEQIIYDISKWADLKPLDTNSLKIKQVTWEKYFKEEFPKKQITLHHTVSGPGISGDVTTWQAYTANIATCTLIERDGIINQFFSSKYWAYHLGCGKKILDQQSIGVELDNWGQLHEIEGQLFNSYNGKVNVPISHYPTGFRGSQIYEAYSYEQLRSLGELLLLWKSRYNIPLTYNQDMFDVSKNALEGKSGVWTHVSYRLPSDKSDCHPDPNLINMLKTISTLK